MTFWVAGAFGIVLFLPPLLGGEHGRPIDVMFVTACLGGLCFGLVMSALLWGVLYPYRAWVVRRQNPALFDWTELATDDRGVEFKTSRGAMRYGWSDFRGYREGKIVFSLCLSKSAGFTVPKGHMSPEVIGQFRDELDRKLKRLR